MGKIIAFVSYAHDDDVFDGGAISYLAQKIELTLRTFTARSDLVVFFDRKSIDWGDAWRARVAEGLADSAVLIAIVTPNFLSSEECRSETEAFIRLPQWDRWLLPIYYIEVDDFNSRKDPVTAAVRSVQYKDWTQLRTLGRDTLKVRRAIERLARDIQDRLRTTLAKSSKSPVVESNPSREYRAQVAGDDAATSDWVDVLVAAHAAREDDEYGLARALLLHGIDRFANAWLVWELASVDWYKGVLDDAVAGFERALDMPPDEEFSRSRCFITLDRPGSSAGSSSVASPSSRPSLSIPALMLMSRPTREARGHSVLGASVGSRRRSRSLPPRSK